MELKRIQKLNTRLLIIFFIFFLFCISVYLILSPDQKQSYVENRTLGQKPELSLAKLVDGTYVKEFEEYFTDQFPARNLWLKTYLDLQVLSGKTLLNGYYVASDGWILPMPKYHFSKPNVKKASDNLNEFAIHATQKGAEVFYFSLPHKVNTVKIKLPSHISEGIGHAKKDYFLSQVSNQHLKLLDVGNIFKAQFTQKELNNLYFKTDHHWNATGSFYGYKEIKNFLKDNSKHFTEREPEYSTTYYNNKFEGSYNRQIYDLVSLRTDKVTHVLPKDNSFKKFRISVNGKKSSFAQVYGSFINKKNKLIYGDIFTGDFRKINISNPIIKDGRLLIVKDSYANPIIFHVAQHYQQTVVFDLRHNQQSLLDFIQKEQSFDTIIFLYNDANIEGPMFEFKEASPK